MSEYRDFIEPASPETYGEAAVTEHLEPETATMLRRYVRAKAFASTGDDFLDILVRLLWSEIDAQLVFIGSVNTQTERVETRVAFRDGMRAGNFSYSLSGSPCETVVGPLQACVYPVHVAERFPQDVGLREMSAEGYVGLPLFDRLGNRLGIMVAITKTPVENPSATVALMRFFARRAALDLEQLRAVEQAAEDLAQLEAALEAADSEIDAALSRFDA